jgi:hypothetical protein
MTNKYIHPYVYFVQYDAQGGIMQHGSMAQGFVDDIVSKGGNWLIGVKVGIDQRVNIGTLELEPKTACAAVVDGTTIKGLPLPCRVTIDFVQYDVDDGQLEFEFTQPGEYVVTVVSATHLTGQYVVTYEG